MIDSPLKPSDGAFGWLVTVKRHKGQRLPDRYYVADEQAAMSRVRQTLRLQEIAEISLRYALSREDVSDLNLKPGDVVKAGVGRPSD
jgi:hypothetical protein